MAANAFAVPPPLVAARKKRRADAGAAPAADSLSFFTAADHARHAQLGLEAEARRFRLELQRRRAILAADAKAPAEDAEASKASRLAALKAKHILHVLEEFMLKRGPSAGNKHGLELFSNGRRRLSAIPICEHEEYLALTRKKSDALRRGLPEILALTTIEVASLQELQAKATEEQIIFSQLFHSVMGPVNAENQTVVPSFASRWFEAVATFEANEVQRLYPKYFEPAVSIPIHPGSEAPTDDQLIKHVSEVLRTGSAVTIAESQLVAGLPIDEKIKTADAASWKPLQARHDPMSVDPHAERLMLKHNCDISISSSTLLELFDLSTSSPVLGAPERHWTIPMKIRVVVGPDGSPRKLIYLDRVLRGRNLSTRDKIALAGSALLPDALTTNSEEQGSGQISYHVWLIRGTRVLVRSTVRMCLLEDGHDPTTSAESDSLSTGRKNPLGPVAMSLFVKPDYCDLGLKEHLNASERCKLWLHSWLRGNSRIVVARVAPKQCLVHEWEYHSLESLIYGHGDTGEAHYAEYINPMKNFELVANLFGNTCDMATGTYLIRPHFHDKRAPRLEIMTSSPGKDPSPSDETDSRLNLESLLRLTDRSVDDSKCLAHASVLPEWYRYDRIPYTFRTGIYCRLFLQDGFCPAIASAEYCEGRHIRLAQTKGTAPQWHFEDFTAALRRGKHVDQHRIRPPGRPVILIPSFPFCSGNVTSAVAAANLNAPVKCPKKKGECDLRHFSPHEIAERVADEAERRERVKRRNFKNGARSKRAMPGVNGSGEDSRQRLA